VILFNNLRRRYRKCTVLPRVRPGHWHLINDNDAMNERAQFLCRYLKRIDVISDLDTLARLIIKNSKTILWIFLSFMRMIYRCIVLCVDSAKCIWTLRKVHYILINKTFCEFSLGEGILNGVREKEYRKENVLFIIISFSLSLSLVRMKIDEKNKKQCSRPAI